jgi:hypothetical protein
MIQAQPILIDIGEREVVDPTTMGDVLLTAIGLTGVLVIIGLMLGAVLGALFILWKRRRDATRLDGPRAGAESGAVHISPYS